MNSTITANAVLKQKSDLRLKMQLIGNEYFIQNDVIATPVADNIIASTYKYDSEHPAIKALVSEFTKRVGKIPSQDLYVALAYDGYSVLFDAMSACGGDDPECIKKVLYAVKDYHGASGVITIDQNGDTKREFVLKRVIGGKLIEVK